LENVTIPRIQFTLNYIDRELDELEREGKFIDWNFKMKFLPTAIDVTFFTPHFFGYVYFVFLGKKYKISLVEA
jgi:hypothetical protein